MNPNKFVITLNMMLLSNRKSNSRLLTQSRNQMGRNLLKQLCVIQRAITWKMKYIRENNNNNDNSHKIYLVSRGKKDRKNWTDRSDSVTIRAKQRNQLWVIDSLARRTSNCEPFNYIIQTYSKRYYVWI